MKDKPNRLSTTHGIKPSDGKHSIISGILLCLSPHFIGLDEHGYPVRQQSQGTDVRHASYGAVDRTSLRGPGVILTREWTYCVCLITLGKYIDERSTV